jgi:hypothetical protein
MDKQSIKTELAQRLTKAQGDLAYKRISQIEHSKEVNEIYKEAKIYAIGVNEVLSDAMQNGSQYEKQLEKKLNQQFSSDFKPAA